MRRNRQPDLPFVPAPLPVAELGPAERIACLRLIRSEHVGPVTFRQLINHFGGAAAALDALPELARRGGNRRGIRVCPKARAEAELEAAERCGAHALFTIEPGYPRALASIDMPPPMIYAKGRTEVLAAPMIAIVGSREASAAGIRLAQQMAADLGHAGLAIVSGLARGIDRAAHEASLGTGTVAVLAGGIDIVYPPEHAELQRRIGEDGCLLSEMPPGFEPRAREFPRRNRIVSGLSHGVVVIEAARRSGTLITARIAGEQGREVFAVPGHPLDPRAEGTNRLIKTGATLVTEASDILEALEPQLGLAARGLSEPPPPEHELEPLPAPARAPLGDDQRAAVLGALGPAPVDIDTIVRATRLNIREVNVVLMELDLGGRLARHGGQLVSLLDAPLP